MIVAKPSSTMIVSTVDEWSMSELTGPIFEFSWFVVMSVPLAGPFNAESSRFDDPGDSSVSGTTTIAPGLARQDRVVDHDTRPGALPESPIDASRQPPQRELKRPGMESHVLYHRQPVSRTQHRKLAPSNELLDPLKGPEPQPARQPDQPLPRPIRRGDHDDA